MVLFRAVSLVELLNIQVSGRFRTISGQMEGKWFAETANDAERWGERLHGNRFSIVRASVPDEMAERLFRVASLDAIGPARWADGDDLPNVFPLL